MQFQGYIKPMKKCEKGMGHMFQKPVQMFLNVQRLDIRPSVSYK